MTGVLAGCPDGTFKSTLLSDRKAPESLTCVLFHFLNTTSSTFLSRRHNLYLANRHKSLPRQ
jgi:hypothetical protein